MSSPQYPHDLYGGDQQDNVWEQSQPTGNVWDPQATDAWEQQAVSSDSPYGLPTSPGGPVGQSAPPPQHQPPQVQPRPQPHAAPGSNNLFTALFDLGFTTRMNAAAIKLSYQLGTITALLLGVAILVAGITSNNLSLMMITIFLAPLVSISMMALLRAILETRRADAGELD